MGITYQEQKASFDISKAYRQFRRADKCLAKDNYNDAQDHLNRGLNLFGDALDHLAKAEDDAYDKAGKSITKGNDELQKSIDDYAEGKYDSAARHYEDAQEYYDSVLDLV